MDDRSQKIQLNNPIPLHFYSPADRLPHDHHYKIVLRKSILKPDAVTFCLANYFDDDNKWYSDDLYDIRPDEVIAWASFSPEWVVGVDL